MVTEKVQEHFNKVVALISNVKKHFLKAPSRVLKLKSMGPTIPLLPQLIDRLTYIDRNFIVLLSIY